MALHSLSEVRNLKDPLKQYQVTFTIAMTPGMSIALGQQKLIGALNGNDHVVDAKTIELRCTSFTYPGTKLSQSELIISGFRRKLATLQNKSGVWECKVTEDYNGAVLNTIQSWCDLIHNPMTGSKMPSTYYVTSCIVDIDPCFVFEKTARAHSPQGRRIYLKGFYPIEYSVGQIDASSSNPVEVTIKFNYDWFTESVTSISSLMGRLGQ